jgi:hypothetical protein
MMESELVTEDSPLSERSLSILDEADYALQQSRLAEFREVYLSVTELSEAQRYHAQISGLEAALKRHDEVSFGILQEVMLTRIDGERHMGRLLLALPRNPGERTDLGRSRPVSQSYRNTLVRLGMERETARRWQHLALAPEDGYQAARRAVKFAGRAPSRNQILKDAYKLSSGEMLQDVAGEWLESCWPNLELALMSVKDVVLEAYALDPDDLQWVVDRGFSAALAKRLLTPTESMVEFGDLDPDRAKADLRSAHSYQPIGNMTWDLVDSAIDKAAARRQRRGNFQGLMSEQQLLNAPASGDINPDFSTSGPDNNPELNSTSSARQLNPLLGVLGQLDRLPTMEPEEFVARLREVRDPAEVERWCRRIEQGCQWLTQALRSFRSGD